MNFPTLLHFREVRHKGAALFQQGITEMALVSCKQCHRFVFSQLKNGKCFVIIAQRPQASTLELLRAKTQNSQGCLWPFSGPGCFWHPIDLVLPEPEHISRVPVKKDKVNASFNGLLGQTFPFFVTSCNLVPSFYV